MIKYTRSDVLLGINHVSLNLGGRPILRDVNAEVRNIVREDGVAGQVICFLGPSGIGKTQLSRVIAGLQPPTFGSVHLATGHGLKKAAPGLVCVVPQNYPLFLWTTVRGNLEIAGRAGGLNSVDLAKKMLTMVEALDISSYLDEYPSRLSGGTRQRVAIARQMMCPGHFLILDEPFSGLDPVMKLKTSELITRVANLDELNTVIIVTHDVTEGLAVADTVWLMGLDEGVDGKKIPGARLVEQYDLAEMGLCWRKDIISDPMFISFVANVKHRFHTLK